MTAIPFQNPRADVEFGVPPAAAEAQVWIVARDGRRYGGAAGIAVALGTATQRRLPTRLYAIDWITGVADAVYAWVAVNRDRLPGDRPYCEQFPADCDLALT